MFTNDLISSRSPFWGYVNSIIGSPIYGSPPCSLVSCLHIRDPQHPIVTDDLLPHRWAPRWIPLEKRPSRGGKMVQSLEYRGTANLVGVARVWSRAWPAMVWFYVVCRVGLPCVWWLSEAFVAEERRRRRRRGFPGTNTRGHKGHTAPARTHRVFMVCSIGYYCYGYI